MSPTMLTAVYGALAMGHIAIASVFLRFWTRVRAALLIVFAVSFVLMALSYGLLCLSDIGNGWRTAAYLLRLSAFIFIILGIVSTNLQTRSGA
ncbi:MAG: DUF5985 family protein [Rhodospirillaceae bacterium]